MKSTETRREMLRDALKRQNFSNFGSLKSTETGVVDVARVEDWDFSNFGSLKSTETVGYANKALKEG